MVTVSSPPCWRGDYGHYLRRPDLKQEFVSEWQKYFNSSMWDCTRFDEQTKAELHLRLDVRAHFASVRVFKSRYKDVRNKDGRSTLKTSCTSAQSLVEICR